MGADSVREATIVDARIPARIAPHGSQPASLLTDPSPHRSSRIPALAATPTLTATSRPDPFPSLHPTLGIYRDDHETDPRRRYKGFGPGCWRSGSCPLKDPFGRDLPNRLPPAHFNATAADFPTKGQGDGEAEYDGDLAVSADGIVWESLGFVGWPACVSWNRV
jgi:hypothetical protein